MATIETDGHEHTHAPMGSRAVHSRPAVSASGCIRLLHLSLRLHIAGSPKNPKKLTRAILGWSLSTAAIFLSKIRGLASKTLICRCVFDQMGNGTGRLGGSEKRGCYNACGNHAGGKSLAGPAICGAPPSGEPVWKPWKLACSQRFITPAPRS